MKGRNMFAVLFNRVTASSHHIALDKTFETRAEAYEHIVKRYNVYVTEKGFDPDYSRLDEGYAAFISTYRMDDYIVMCVVSLAGNNGYEFNPYLDWALCAHDAGILED